MADDPVSAANFIGSDKLLATLHLIKTAKTFSLALPLQGHGVSVKPERGASSHLMTLDDGNYAAGFSITRGFCASNNYLDTFTRYGTPIDTLGHT